MTNHEILNVKPGASKDEIKKAFHRLAHIHHPDKGGDPKKFIEVKNAYEALIKGDNGPTISFHGTNGPGAGASTYTWYYQTYNPRPDFYEEARKANEKRANDMSDAIRFMHEALKKQQQEEINRKKAHAEMARKMMNGQDPFK